MKNYTVSPIPIEKVRRIWGSGFYSGLSAAKKTDYLWDWMCSIETNLAVLEELALSDSSKNEDEAFSKWLWYYRPLVVELAGFFAHKKELKTTQAYDIAYEIILETLRSVSSEHDKSSYSSINRLNFLKRIKK